MEEETTQPGFWDQAGKAKRVLRELKIEKTWVETVTSVQSRVDDLNVLLELAAEEEDEATAAEAAEEAKRLEADVDALEIKSLFREEADSRAAILTVHPGAGGVDSQDWAEMLFRMYLRW
ncbi:MAG: PCRF domain-containing protein, partial [Gemmatimonadetes bacterium]|nr:PCRF domain-containing protein [Gemmatimonadota bacterium]